MARGFKFLIAVVDVVSRRVLAYKVAITLEARHAGEALEQAFGWHERSEILHADRAASQGHRIH